MRDWILKRGILYGLTQMPLAAIIFGHFIKVLPYPVMIYGVIIGFVALPIWISFRKQRSDDPNEPVHHIHRFALWALIPFPIFSLLRIPTHFLFGMSYWHPWYDFGSALTGYSINQIPSLIAGAILYSIQGYSLTFGYYILFERRSLMNAVLYICVFDSALYSFVFPTFGRIGMASPPIWHSVAWLAHLGMAVTAWAIPVFWESTFPLFKRSNKVLSVIGVMAIVCAPYGFPIWRAMTWQFPFQELQDQEVFRQARLEQVGELAVLENSTELRVKVDLQFGPRMYKNYVKRLRAIDIADVKVHGRLISEGKVVAWCETQLNDVDSPNRYLEKEKEFAASVEQLNLTKFSVTCFGPRREGLMRDVKFEWSAEAKLIGERIARTEKFGTVK